MHDAAAPGPSTPASAPQAPGRLGREDASNFRGGTLPQYLPEMERWAVVAFGGVLVLVCAFWIYGYFRRRTKG